MTHTTSGTKLQAETTTQKQTTSTLGLYAVRRSWRQRWIFPLLLMLAMVLSLSTYLALDSIQQSVDDYVADNQRALVGGDLVLTTKQAWTDDVLQVVKRFTSNSVLAGKQKKSDTQAPDTHGAHGGTQNSAVYDYQFSAMITRPEASTHLDKETASHTLLARVKAVSSAYPLYGEVVLASGEPLWQKLTVDTVVVEAQVLTGLGLRVGDRIRIGEASFTIADELLAEPDRPLTAFGFGARVLMFDESLPATELMGQRSRINYRIELAGTPVAIDSIRAELTTLLEGRLDVKLTDADNANTSISRISDNVLAFLKLLVIAVLFLSAVANLSVINTFVALEYAVIAVRRALGESVFSIKQSYYRVFMVTALLAFLGSVFISFFILHLGSGYLSAVLPPSMALSINPLSVIKVALITLGLTLLLVWRSLYAVTHIKPSAVLKKSPVIKSRTQSYWYGWFFLFAVLLMAYEFNSLFLGLKILGAMLALTLCFWLLAKGGLRVLNRLAHRSGWLWRTAVHNLSRKGNQSVLFFVTLALSVAMLSMVTLLNHSLTQQFVSTYPKDAPNLFVLDIQQHQQKQLGTMVEAPLTFYPVVRARISDVNGTPVADMEPSHGDDPKRMFNLSYDDTLADTEFIVSSLRDDALYAPVASDITQNKSRSGHKNDTVVPMSILDTAADMLDVKLNDRIRFDIQGVELVAHITSIRRRYERGPSPFFYFLFEPNVLVDAPQLRFATARVQQKNMPRLQTDLARAFPAITTIDGGAIAKRVQGFVAQMSQLVFVFTALALITGVMVLVTSLLSTSQDRLRESASFRLLGMKTRDLYLINCLEIGILGLGAGLVAVVGASLCGWLVITQWFDLRFFIPWSRFFLGAVVLAGLLVVIAISYVKLVVGKGIMARVRKMI